MGHRPATRPSIVVDTLAETASSTATGNSPAAADYPKDSVLKCGYNEDGSGSEQANEVEKEEPN